MGSLLIQLSQQFLLAQKKNENSDKFIEQLAGTSELNLFNELKNDTDKKTFWINCYNAFSVYLLKQTDANILLSNLKRKAHFGSKQITIAGQKMSLNDIEHSFLRKSRIWWSRGYLQKWLVSDFEKKVRVNKLDYRIHFALNCGGMSCPPIRYYETEKLENQLELAAASFLKTESAYNKTNNTVTVSRLLNWYKADFEGNTGIIKMLKQHQIIPTNVTPKIKYANYSWSTDIDNFS